MSSPRPLSRRQFAALVAASAAAGAATPLAFPRSTTASQAARTVRDVLDRIRTQIGVDWQADTVDTVKAGDPDVPITGIVTTSLATIPVLRQAVAAGANLIVTTHPTFYARSDARTPPAGRGTGPAGGPPAPPPPDPVFAAKNDLIARNGLVIFRLSDHWRARRPDPRAVGIGAAMGWPSDQVPDDPARYTIPATTLDALAREIRTTLQVRGGLRVIGDAGTRITRVALLPGSTPMAAALSMLPAVDAIVGGEVREWESAEYVRDAAHAGGGKGLILIGRIVSEEAGMAQCATWLGTLVPGIPVRHIAAGDPYWRPA